MTDPIREALQRIVELVHKYRALLALPDTSEWLEAITAAEDVLSHTNLRKEWQAVYNAAALQLDPLACCLIELRDRVAALEAVGAVAGNPGHAFAAPATADTADGLSPVEPARRAPQGVTYEELVCLLHEVEESSLERLWKSSNQLQARHLLAHPRLGPLLRGEGAAAPNRVVLPEEPSNGPALRELNRTRDRGCFLAGWKAARAEAFQQGGQADD